MKYTIVILGILFFCCIVVVAGTGAGDLYNFTKATSNVSYTKVAGYDNFSLNMSWNNFTTMVEAPYFNVVGNIFYFLVLGIPLFMLWMRQDSVLMPVIIGFIIGIAGWNYLPIEYHVISVMFLSLSIAGILFGIFKALR